MTGVATFTGASSTNFANWESIDWAAVEKLVFRLQVRIAKAIREGKYGKAKSLQWVLTHSFYAKLLAVRRVSSNKGARTPGVDGVKWNTARKKMEAAKSLKQKGYVTSPLRRIYIPKSNGKKRPLSIPVMKCRGMQALHLMSLEPITETLADHKSFGFRPMRSTADAIEHCFVVLCRKDSAQWILEGDIRSCFDKIKHEWLEANVPMHKGILRKWLKAGYVEKNRKFSTTEGTPQGGIISPTLLVYTLSGLDAAIKKAVHRSDKVNLVVYADDFIVTGKSKEVLEEKVKPAIIEFLRERGLELSSEKTKITHIDDGFDFLGQNIRKYDGKLLIKPSSGSVKKFLEALRKLIRANASVQTQEILRLLCPKIRGWGNYHRHVVSKETFYKIDWQIFHRLWRWAVRRHPMKTKAWIKAKYYRCRGNRDWVFSVRIKTKRKSEPFHYDLLNMGDVPIQRHTKIKGDANPYDPKFFRYFKERERKRMTGSNKLALLEA